MNLRVYLKCKFGNWSQNRIKLELAGRKKKWGMWQSKIIEIAARQVNIAIEIIIAGRCLVVWPLCGTCSTCTILTIWISRLFFFFFSSLFWNNSESFHFPVQSAFWIGVKRPDSLCCVLVCLSSIRYHYYLWKPNRYLSISHDLFINRHSVLISDLARSPV